MSQSAIKQGPGIYPGISMTTASAAVRELPGRRVLAVGRIHRPRPACRDFNPVAVRDALGNLVTVTCASYAPKAVAA